MKITRIYLRVSTSDQDLARQERIVVDAKRGGYYVAGVYRETASGARPDRPALLRLIEDLQDGDVVIAETMDRRPPISRDQYRYDCQTGRLQRGDGQARVGDPPSRRQSDDGMTTLSYAPR